MSRQVRSRSDADGFAPPSRSLPGRRQPRGCPIRPVVDSFTPPVPLPETAPEPDSVEVLGGALWHDEHGVATQADRGA